MYNKNITKTSCLTRILNYYESLTPSEQKIADFINNNPELVVKFTIHKLASAIGCAPSSITKFVRKLDYASFSAMRIELAKSVDSVSAQDFSEILSWGNSRDHLSQIYIKNISGICSDTLEINEFDKFLEVARLVTQAQNVYLFGVGTSAVIAQDLQHKLIKLKKHCMYSLDGNFGLQNASLATEKDVAFAISHSGQTDEVNLAAQKIKEAKCPLVALTRYSKTPLAAMADINLYVPNTEPVNRVTSIFSRYAFLFLVDIVFLNVMQLIGEEPEKVLHNYRGLHNIP